MGVCFGHKVHRKLKLSEHTNHVCCFQRETFQLVKPDLLLWNMKSCPGMPPFSEDLLSGNSQQTALHSASGGFLHADHLVLLRLQLSLRTELLTPRLTRFCKFLQC